MNPINELRFALSDSINDVEVGPKHVPLALLGEFQKDVKEFLNGSGRDIDPKQVMVSIEEGSLALWVSGVLAAASLWADIEHLQSSNSLNLIDAKRANVVERWQNAALSNPHRRYVVADRSSQVSFFVDLSSNYRRPEEVWARVEKYLYGTVTDLGGKTNANVHLQVAGEALTIAASQDLLAKEQQNHLYRQILVRVTAEENLFTGALRNFNLLSFESYQPRYDDDEFKRMVERGTQAWADIPDSSAWVESLRGGDA